MAMNDTPRIQRSVLGSTKDVTHEPRLAAMPWFNNVAIKMPKTMGKGR